MITLTLDDDECLLIRMALLSLCDDSGIVNEHERLLDKIDAISGTVTHSKFYAEEPKPTPIGTQATLNGLPVIMTANGWRVQL